MKNIHAKDTIFNTKPISDNSIIDIDITGMSYYQNFIDNNYVYDNLSAEIKYLSPNEYYYLVSYYSLLRGYSYSIVYLKHNRASDIDCLNYIKQVLQIKRKTLCIPILDFYHKKQEGLHRMMVIGDLYGWDFKVPVLIVYKNGEEPEIINNN